MPKRKLSDEDKFNAATCFPDHPLAGWYGYKIISFCILYKFCVLYNKIELYNQRIIKNINKV